MGSDLYNNLIKYFVNHLKTLRTVSRAPATPKRGTIYLSACAPHLGIGRIAGRSAAAVLRSGVGSIHNWCKLHQPSFHIP